MKARIIRSLIDTGSAARDYIRLVCGRKQSSLRPVAEDEIRGGAPTILESFRNHRRQSGSQHVLTGKNVITAMDEQLTDIGFIPYLLSRDSGEFADRVTRGSFVSLPGDDRRFHVVKILWERESIRLRDDEGRDYVVPWQIIKMKYTKSFSVTMSGEEAADLILSGVYVRRVGVTPADPNLYLTVRHLYDRESSIIRNVWTGKERVVPWNNIEFA